ncbi:hypothetical protein EJB05_43315, partial [Eragrostis curvula]
MQPQQPPPPQQQRMMLPPPQQQRMMLPPPQGFVGGGIPQQAIGGLAEAEAAARARAAEQMAVEDAWNALNPDFRTPFTSVEDAVSNTIIGPESKEEERRMGEGDQGLDGPTHQRLRIFEVEALQQPRQQQPPQPRIARPVMQQQQQPPPPQQQRMMLPPPQGFVGGGIPQQGIGGFSAVAAPVSRAEAEAVARARVAEQMAIEDAWKALNPDFRTPFTSVEDAVSRLLPYHVFADEDDYDYGVDGNCDNGAAVTEKSSAQEFEDEMKATTEYLFSEFEKQVLTFNILTRQRAEGINRGEEGFLLEMALLDDERRQMEHVRAALAQKQQQEQREKQEAARARLALAHAQAAAGGGWSMAPPSPASWPQTLAAAARGEGSSGGQAMSMQQHQILSPQPMQQQEEMMTPGAWQALAAVATSRGESGQALIQAGMMQQQQQQELRQKQQLEMMAAAAAARGAGWLGGQALPPAVVMQLLHQQHEMMAAGTWQQMGGRQSYMGPRSDGSSSSSQTGAVLQQQQPGKGQMALPWRSSAERSEQ